MNLDELQQAIIKADLTDAELTQLLVSPVLLSNGSDAHTRFFFTFCISCTGNACTSGCTGNSCTHGCSTSGCVQGASVL